MSDEHHKKISQFDDGVGSLVEETLPAEPPEIAGTDDPTPRLGPFALEEQIGEGGSGVVWRGRHGDQDLPVAVKFITKLGSRPDEARRRFRTEVRSVAALNHPGIITVLDYGEVSTELAHRMGGQIPSGVPYMVTEFARAGTLLPFIGEVDWPFCRALLLSLLDALAHAHARDVIHRDIKPTNVLIDQGAAASLSTISHTDLEGDALRVKLTDFGIALRRDRVLDPGSEVAENVEEEGAVGTPYYMAPEQLQARWRDYGPWTDLYALGCMAWQLITGHRPFGGNSLMSVARAQLVEPLPDFEPLFAVPDRLRNWLTTILQKRPDHRFRSAADAALALATLGEADCPDGQADTTVRVPDRLLQTPDASFPAEWQPTLETLQLDLHQASESLDLPAGFPTPDDIDPSADDRPPLQRRRPPLPDRWAREGVSRPPLAVVGAGLRLFGLRELPVVGHRQARDRLWKDLREAVGAATDDGEGKDAPSPRLVLLHGAAGIGKSRLARWLVHRAGEVGAANTMRASHDKAGQAPLEALRGMVDRYLGCVGQSNDETRRRIATWYDQRGITGPEDEPHYEVGALADLLAPEEEHGNSAGQIRMQEAFGILQAFVQRAARHDRPLILHLDDVHWGRETLQWARRLLEGPGGTGSQAPILVVATYRDESLAERPREAELVGDLTDHPAVSSLELDPLSPRHLRKLLELGLRLKPELAFEVLERADGNPLFATQLVQTWADRELLEVGDGGFRLTDSAEDLLPDDLYEVWSERLDRALGDAAREQYRDQYVALELGATLGRQPRRDEWEAACQRAGVPFPEALVERLLKNRLLEDTDTGWRFAHNMLRETLERHARRGGRWKRHNRACADVVRAFGDDSGPEQTSETGSGHSQRLAEFLLEAEDWEAAIDPLLEAIDHRGRMGRLDAAGYLLERLEEAMETVDLKNSDPRAALYHLRTGRFELAHHQSLDAAEEHFRRALSLSEAEFDGGGILRSRALAALGRIAHRRHDYERARARVERALETCPEEAVELRGRIHRELGTVNVSADRPDQGIEHLTRARELLADHPVEQAKAIEELGETLFIAGRPEEAQEALEASLQLFDALDCMHLQVHALNWLADVKRALGDIQGAMATLREAEIRGRTIDSPDLPYIYLTHVEFDLEQGRWTEADQRLDVLEERLPPQLRAIGRTFRFVVCVHVERWEEARSLLAPLEETYRDDFAGKRDGLQFLRQAREYLEDSGREDLLERLEALID